MLICQNGPLCEFVKMGLLINLYFLKLFMHSSLLYIITYGAIEFMRYKFMQPALDLHNSHKKKSHA